MKIFDDVREQIVNGADRRVLIEAFGTPGVGKSYICASLQASFLASKGHLYYHSIDGYSSSFIARLLYKVFFIIKSLLFEFEVIRANLTILSYFENLKVLVKCKLFLNLLLISSLVVSNRKKESPLLIDQGILQGIWSLYYYNNETIKPVVSDRLVNSVCSLFESLRLDALVVLHVKAENSVIKSRLFTRRVKGSSPLNSLEESALCKANYATAYSRRTIDGVIKRSEKICIIDIEN